MPRVRALLSRGGIADASDADVWGERAPALADAAAASVQGLVTAGPGVRRPLRIAAEGQGQHDGGAARLNGCHARADGFDLHADVRMDDDWDPDFEDIRPNPVRLLPDAQIVDLPKDHPIFSTALSSE